VNLLFGFNGRIGRGKYWLGVLVIFIVNIAMVVGAISLSGGMETLANADPQTMDPNAVQQAMLPLYAAMLPGLYISLAVFAKRLHDMGQTGWLSLLSLVPLVGIGMFFWMGFAGGKPGPNEYGPDPRAA
jgi:uncharacterized membrane protein YhaH (DUF805 family)